MRIHGICVYRVCIDHQYVLAPYWHLIGDVLATYWRRIGDVLAHIRIGDVLATYWRRIGDVSATYWRRIGDVLAHTRIRIRYVLAIRHTPHVLHCIIAYLHVLSMYLSYACSYYASIRCHLHGQASRSEEVDEEIQGGMCHHHVHARAQAVLPPSSIPRAPGSPQLRLAHIPCSRSPSTDVGPADAKSTGG